MSSEESSSNTLGSPETDEFTLQDTYENLKDIQEEKRNEIEELINIIKNNAVSILGPNTTLEDIINKQQKILQSIEKLVLNEDPKFCPIPKTADMYMTAVQGLEDEVQKMNAVLDGMNQELSCVKNDVSYLEDKKSGFEKMKEAALNAAEDEAKNTYEEEYAIVKSIFTETKADLSKVIDMVFPDNDGVYSFLVELNKAQLKGGDDVYVQIDEDNIQYTNFLEATGIIVFHPNDKNLCKMVSLL